MKNSAYYKKPKTYLHLNLMFHGLNVGPHPRAATSTNAKNFAGLAARPKRLGKTTLKRDKWRHVWYLSTSYVQDTVFFSSRHQTLL